MSDNGRDLTQEYVKECFSYDNVTGDLIWRSRPINHFSTFISHRRTNSQFAGKKAGWCNKGYLNAEVNGVIFRVHRLVWLYNYGEFPPDQIDHINRVKSDNRLENLRCVNNSENQKNSGRYKNNTSGHAGVTKTRNGKWLARISHEGSRIRLGLLNNIEDAIKVRKAAEKEYGYGAPI